jgi:hypothetical protein
MQPTITKVGGHSQWVGSIEVIIEFCPKIWIIIFRPMDQPSSNYTFKIKMKPGLKIWTVSGYLAIKHGMVKHIILGEIPI